MKFRQYLSEARMAPLYHATNKFAFLDMINDGKILPMTAHVNKELRLDFSPSTKLTYGISTTRDFRFAKKWSDEGIILELDQRAVSQRYKIYPFQYWQRYKVPRNKAKARDLISPARPSPSYQTNESEEFIVTANGIPFSKFITTLWLKKDQHQIGTMTILTFKDKYPHIEVKYYG